MPVISAALSANALAVRYTLTNSDLVVSLIFAYSDAFSILALSHLTLWGNFFSNLRKACSCARCCFKSSCSASIPDSLCSLICFVSQSRFSPGCGMESSYSCGPRWPWFLRYSSSLIRPFMTWSMPIIGSRLASPPFPLRLESRRFASSMPASFVNWEVNDEEDCAESRPPDINANHALHKYG